MKIAGIYRVVSPSKKVYVGQSWDILGRFSQHKREKRVVLVLNKSLHKYGHQNHLFEILHELPSDTDQSVMDSYEQIYIDAFTACGFEIISPK